jgi:diketogulonate reductase-like aldo/keto reductase
MSNLSKNKDLVLNNGVEIPLIGFGTYKMNGYELEKGLEVALEVGYRHIDTAAMYNNEKEIGTVLKNCGVKREDLFITSKVSIVDMGYDTTKAAIDVSLDKLQTESVDLYLVHWPEPGKKEATWEALIELYDERKTRAIGVSNYTEKHIDELMKKSPITPVVNQFEITPFLYQKELAEKCESYDIKVQAHSPLVRGTRLKNPVLIEIAEQYAKSTAQVLIRWSLEKGFIVLPKSSNPERIKQNIDVFDFELTDADIRKIDALNNNMRISWDPSGLE